MTEWPIVPIARRRGALIAFFFVPGIGLSSWVTRTPAIRESLGAVDAADECRALRCLDRIYDRHPHRRVPGGALRCSSRHRGGDGQRHPLPAHRGRRRGSALDVDVTLGVALFGLGAGTGEVALNVEGAAGGIGLGQTVPARPARFLQRRHRGGIGPGQSGSRRSTFRSLASARDQRGHGPSIPVLHAVRGAGNREEADGNHDGCPPGDSVWKDTRCLLIGAIVLAIAFTEGTATTGCP